MQLEQQQEEIIASLRAELEKRHNLDIDNLKKLNLEELAKQEQDLLTSKKLQIQALEAKLLQDQEAAILEINSQHEKRVSEMRTNLESVQTTAFDQLQDRFKKELKEVTENAVNEREISLERENNLAIEINNMKEQLNESQQLTLVLNSRIAELNEELNKSKKLNSNYETEKDNLKSKLQEESLQEQEKLKNLHQAELNKQKNYYLELKNQMTIEFNSIQSELNERIQSQDSNIKKWKDKWSSRGPRQEDKDKIEQLQEMMRQKDATIDNIMKDKRFYQEELANRDRNFTKIFHNGSMNWGKGVCSGFQN